jgi:hypothetical protein
MLLCISWASLGICIAAATVQPPLLHGSPIRSVTHLNVEGREMYLSIDADCVINWRNVVDDNIERAVKVMVPGQCGAVHEDKAYLWIVSIIDTSPGQLIRGENDFYKTAVWRMDRRNLHLPPTLVHEENAANKQTINVFQDGNGLLRWYLFSWTSGELIGTFDEEKFVEVSSKNVSLSPEDWKAKFNSYIKSFGYLNQLLDQQKSLSGARLNFACNSSQSHCLAFGIDRNSGASLYYVVDKRGSVGKALFGDADLIQGDIEFANDGRSVSVEGRLECRTIDLLNLLSSTPFNCEPRERRLYEGHFSDYVELVDGGIDFDSFSTGANMIRRDLIERRPSGPNGANLAAKSTTLLTVRRNVVNGVMGRTLVTTVKNANINQYSISTILENGLVIYNFVQGSLEISGTFQAKVRPEQSSVIGVSMQKDMFLFVVGSEKSGLQIVGRSGASQTSDVEKLFSAEQLNWNSDVRISVARATSFRDEVFLIVAGVGGRVNIYSIGRLGHGSLAFLSSPKLVLSVRGPIFEPTGISLSNSAWLVHDRNGNLVHGSLSSFGTALFRYEDKDCRLVGTTDGFFYASSANCISGFSVGDQSLLEYFDVFYRPDVVKSALLGQQPRGLVGGLTLESAQRKPPPAVSVAVPSEIGTQRRLQLSYKINNRGGGVGEVLVLHNGKLIKSDGYYKDAPGSTMVALNTTKATSNAEVAKGMRKMLGAGETTASAVSTVGNRDSVVVRQAKPKTLNAAGEFSDSVEIDVIPGEDNEITVMARNQDNTILGQGQTVRFKSSLPKADPHLWILPVGIASFQDSGVRKLASPKKDALDFACSYGGKEALKSAGISCDKPGYANSLFKSANIHVIDPLTNEKATRANILAKLDEIAAKAKPTDTFIWFVSSHGTMDANSVYGIVPFDAKCQDPKCDAASGLVSSNDILEKSKSIKAMKQLLILDTCQAGGLDNKMSGLYDARMSGLAKNMGLHLYAAATATESALDGQDASKNSIFTATLLEGLAGASAKNTEGQISIIPLGQYVKTKTPEASRKAYADMTPQTPVIQHFGKDAPLAGVAGR